MEAYDLNYFETNNNYSTQAMFDLLKSAVVKGGRRAGLCYMSHAYAQSLSGSWCK